MISNIVELCIRRHSRQGVARFAAWAIAALAVVALALPAFGGEDAGEKKSQTAPAEKQAMVPAETVKEMENQFKPPQKRMSRKDLIAFYTKNMKKALELGADAEEKYSDAKNIGQVRAMMLQAASVLTNIDRNKDTYNRRLEIAKRLVKSDVDNELKVEGDFVVTLDKVKPYEGKVSEDAEKIIHEFAQQYKDSDAEEKGLMRALLLARAAENYGLEKKYAGMLKEKYGDGKNVQQMLERIGYGPMVGKPFEAELTRLNGEQLNLPEDLKGKVVVIDFWATWCGPCVKEIPHMKEFYAEYQPKGAEIVGISLDRSKDPLEKFVKEKQLEWIQTYNRKNGRNPVATKYGVRAIPSIWVVGADGKIVSTNARGRLEEVVDWALKSAGKATKPATEAPAEDE